MIDWLVQLAAAHPAVPPVPPVPPVHPADRLKLYMALLGLGLVALFAMVLITVLRRVTKPRISSVRDHGKQVSPWEAAGKRARPEGGDGHLPIIGADGGPDGGDHPPHHGHDHSSGDALGGDGGGGGGDGGGGGGGGGD